LPELPEAQGHQSSDSLGAASDIPSRRDWLRPMHEVRPEEPQDFADIRWVHERAFAPSGEEADLVEALRASGAHVPDLCLVALSSGAVVAHIAFSRGYLDSERPALVLAPMAVVPEHQRQGIGSALVSEGLIRAAETEFSMVVVVGHPT